jgi:hypothetical protein
LKKILIIFAIPILSVLGTIAAFLSIIGNYVVIIALQEWFFVPKNYVISIFKYPFSSIAFIFGYYPVGAILYKWQKRYKEKYGKVGIATKSTFLKRYKKQLVSSFLLINLVLYYVTITSVAIIENNKIINHTFSKPLGKVYSFSEIEKIHTGVYGKGLNLPFTKDKGEFFYILQLNDGTKINLNGAGSLPGVDQDTYDILQEIDIKLVNMGISKESSMKNIQFAIDFLSIDDLDKIKIIIQN